MAGEIYRPESYEEAIENSKLEIIREIHEENDPNKIRVPILEEVTTPSISISDVFKRRYSLIDRYK